MEFELMCIAKGGIGAADGKALGGSVGSESEKETEGVRVIAFASGVASKRLIGSHSWRAHICSKKLGMRTGLITRTEIKKRVTGIYL